MSRRKREVPFEQGSIRKIYDRFFKPLIDYKSDSVGFDEWMNQLFHLKYREITQYTSRVDFKMPGLYQEAAHRKIQGLGYRAVTAGTRVMVRKDFREPDYDVEFFGGIGDKDQVFTLSESEWNSIAANLEEVV